MYLSWLLAPALTDLALAAAIGQRSSTTLPTEYELSATNFSSYAPIRIQCPIRETWVRSAGGLSNEESQWVAGRKDKVLQSLTSYLQRLNLTDFDLDTYFARLQQNQVNVPTLAMAISGGAWASAYTGTGILRAIDDRFAPAVEQRTGGLLQSLTYLGALSGGSWPVMSLATYNFPTIDAMVHQWQVNQTRFTAANDTRYAATQATMLKQIAAKYEAGYPLAYMDLLGRAFAYEFVAGPVGGIGTTVSGIANLSNFQDYNMPLPLWQAGSLSPGDPVELGIRLPIDSATIYEWTPFEFGAWNGPASFFPTKYLGTKMADGVPVEECVVGYDRASFMLGAAADATNFWWLEGLSNGSLGSFSKRSTIPSARQGSSKKVVARQSSSSTGPFTHEGVPLQFLEIFEQLFEKYFNTSRDEALYATVPDPFASAQSTNVTSPANISLMDESEMLQSLPLWGLAQPARQVDFIIAHDNDQDALPYDWSNGTNLWGSYLYAQANSVPFPIVPEAATFINRNLTKGPTFFGCEANLTTTNTTDAPIILCLPNAPYSTYTNYTAFQYSYSDENLAAILTNGFNEVTQGNGTLDAEWPECLGCAAIDRSLARVGLQRSAQCQRCFSRYCWDGVSDDSKPGIVDLPLTLAPSVSYAQWNSTGGAEGGTDGTYWAEFEKRK